MLHPNSENTPYPSVLQPKTSVSPYPSKLHPNCEQPLSFSTAAYDFPILQCFSLRAFQALLLRVCQCCTQTVKILPILQYCSLRLPYPSVLQSESISSAASTGLSVPQIHNSVLGPHGSLITYYATVLRPENPSTPYISVLQPENPSTPYISALQPENPSAPYISALQPENPSAPYISALQPENPSTPYISALQPENPKHSLHFSAAA